MKFNIKIAQILDKHLPTDGVGTEREKLRTALMNDLLTLDSNAMDRTEVACICPKKITFDYWTRDFGKLTENYTWVYDINKVRGRMFDKVEKLYEFKKVQGIDDILYYLESHMTSNWKVASKKK